MSSDDRKLSPVQKRESLAGGESVARPSVSPGKRTPTMSLPPRSSSPASAQAPVQHKTDPAAVVQRKQQAALTDQWMGAAVRPDLHDAPVQMLGGEEQSGSDVHGLAAEGISGAATALPHRDQIQRSFGQHDVSGINAHVDGPAAQASQAMGAQAYATGNHVAFQGAPDLHTAAHEAAHIVQQRAGVSLSGGVGQAGDSYEKHADAVADRVVQGESAEGLLSSMTGAGGAGGAGGVQAKEGDDNQVSIRSGELTATGEGSDAQTRFIHWPGTAASGVTLGKGYDIGSRTAEQVVTELTAAGMPADQADKVSKGAGLTGQAAAKFVRENKESVGAISTDVQYALLSDMLVEYTEKARRTATSTTADSSNRNAAGRERREGKEAGTYVMSDFEWDGLHPAMVEFLTDLIYQGGYYGWDRVAKINAALKANTGDHLAQFKGVRELFTTDYMDEYAGKIGERRSGQGSRETFFGQEVDYSGEYRRNSIRLAYLNHVIAALEAGKTVVMSKGGQSDAQAGGSTDTDVATTEPLPGSNGASSGAGGQAGGQAGASTQHVVQRGESLIKLSQKFGVSVDALKAANADKLKRWGSVEGFNAGETITIPTASQGGSQSGSQGGAQEQSPTQAGFSYQVKRGESLIKLSRKFGVSIDDIKAANTDKLKRWGSVEGFNAGETITIPGGGQQQQGSGQQQDSGSQDSGQQDGGQQEEQADAGGKPPWISVAEGELGVAEVRGAQHNPRVLEYHATTGGFSDDETPWCASFVNWVLLQAGQSGTGSARALSFESYGEQLERPAYGSIAVFSWGGGKGHVGFVVGEQGGSILVLGGNQSNQVKISSYGTSQVVAYVVPSGYQVPASAYNLSGSDEEVADGGGMANTR